MKKNKAFLLLVCLIFMLNSFTFNVYALNNGTNSRAIGNVKIVSTVDTSLESVEAWARSKNATETFVGLAKLYKQYAESRGGVNWVVAYVQAAKETGYGRFGGVLDESYHNPCGLKNPSGGGDYDPNAHKRFDTWEQGVLAHLDHLALYASADGFPKTKYVDKWKNEPLAADETYDPRHIGWFGTASGILGKAKDVIGLTGSWASDPNYGIDLFRLYCEASNSEYLPAKSNLESPSNSEIIVNGKLRIKGWALHAFGIKEVKVLVDNAQVATLNTGISRADINSAYPGYFNGELSGFEETIDISQLGTGNKTVEVIIVSRNGETQSHKRNITIGKVNNLPKINTLDTPSDNTVISNEKIKIRGWALDEYGVKEVRVYVDGKDLGTVPYGTNRPDVNNVYPGYPSGNNSGFDGTVDISNISAGDKKLAVKITSNDGTEKTIERTIKVVRLETRICLDEPSSGYTLTGNSLKIRGWALSSVGIKEVRVYVDGKDLGTVPYGTNRADVNNVYPGYPSGNNPGFDGNVDLSNIGSGVKSLKIKVSSNNGNIQEIERKINIQRLETRTCLDSPVTNEIVAGNTLKVRGWALSSSGVREVRAYIDGKDLGTVKYGTERKDVNNVYPGYPSGNNPGFDGIIDISKVGSGDKTLVIKITENNGTVKTIERNFTHRKSKLVVVDPGHEIESVDPGASATHNGIRYVEGNLNLQIAVKLKAQLEAMGIEVYMTRYDGLIIDKDSTESLKKRVKVANELDADLFVSIHHNSYTSPSAHGFEVYYSTGTPVSTNMVSRGLITQDGRDLTLERRSYTARNLEEKSQVSKALATTISNEGSSTLGLYNRGAKDSNLYVCKNTLMPSILIENGFITNPTEAVKVSTTSHQQKLAEIVAKNIGNVLQ